MATFKFGRQVNIHWNGFDVKGPANTVFSIPDQLYEEFEGDIRGVEPSLTWIDTNEFQTLANSVPTGDYVKANVGVSPISISTTSKTSTISISSGTAGNGYLLVADGAGGTIWNPASTSGLTSVVGISPISSVISGGTVSVSIDATLTSADSARRTRSLVRNSTVSTIAKGSFVYIDGSNGTVPTIQKALANADATSARTFGIVEEDITSNSDGYVTNQGLITGIDTSGFANGEVLWLSPTISGAATTTKPAGPNHGVLLGIVVKGGSVGAGSIYIFIKNGAELDEIHDVNISGLATGDILIYSSTASVWQNKTLANAGISASSHTHNYQVAGNYASAVSATSPISSSLSSVGVLSISITTTGFQSAGTYVNSVIGTSPATVSTTSGTATVSIVAGSINSTHLSASSVGSTQIIDGSVSSAKIAVGAVGSAAIAANAVVAGDIAANAVTSGNIAANAVTSGHISSASVNTAKIDSTGGSSGWVLTANGTGGATFAQSSSIISASSTTLTGSGTWNIPAGVTWLKAALLVRGGTGGQSGGGRASNTGSSNASGGDSGGGGDGCYYANVYVGDVTSMTYSVGAGGAGGTATTASKAGGNATTPVTCTQGMGTAGTQSTLGAYLVSNDSVNVGYERMYVFRGGALQSGGSTAGAAGTAGSNNAQNVEIENLSATSVSDREDLRSIGYFVAINYGAGAAGTAGSVTASGLSGKFTTGAGGAAGVSGYFAVQSGGGGNGAGNAVSAGAGGDGYRGGSGGGGAAAFYSTGADTGTTITATGGNGGAGVNGTGCGGGGGGGAIVVATNLTAYTAHTISVTPGSGGKGGDGTIIIWW